MEGTDDDGVRAVEQWWRQFFEDSLENIEKNINGCTFVAIAFELKLLVDRISLSKCW